MEPRLKTEIWVGAYVRRCHAAGAPTFVTRKGDPDAGAVLVVIDRLDGTFRLFGRARALVENYEATGEDGKKIIEAAAFAAAKPGAAKRAKAA